MRETPTTAPLRFALKFVVLFAVLYSAFEASRGSAFERFVIEDLILAPTTELINAVTPAEHVALVGRTIASTGTNLRVTRGCEGVEMLLLLVAGVMAFPASAKQRALGLSVGALLAYVLSVARLMALHYILRYSPQAWEALHGLLLPLGPIVVTALYFLHWSAGTSRGTPPPTRQLVRPEAQGPHRRRASGPLCMDLVED
jgi:exosortase family protein XrtM